MARGASGGLANSCLLSTVMERSVTRSKLSITDVLVYWRWASSEFFLGALTFSLTMAIFFFVPSFFTFFGICRWNISRIMS
jgi:hypothetical protein